MRVTLGLVFVSGAALVGAWVVVAGDESSLPPAFYPGGSTTYLGAHDEDVFSQPSANMPNFDVVGEFALGQSFFFRDWVFSTGEARASDGLGPLFNAPSCISCHVRGGRGGAQAADDYSQDAAAVVSSTVQLSELRHAGIADGQAPLVARGVFPLHVRSPDPTYGFQLQDRALPTVPVEGAFALSYKLHREIRQQDAVTWLYQPQIRVMGLGYGAMSRGVRMSLRIAPALIGLGLVEALRAEDILAAEDAFDEDGDGISGRASWVPAQGYYGTQGSHDLRLGRFGWKADHSTLREQNFMAFFQDMGMTSPFHRASYADCRPVQWQCLQADREDGERHRKFLQQKKARRSGVGLREVSWNVDSEVEEMMLFYTQSLAPLQRRLPADASSAQRQREGEVVFRDIGCHGCHRPSFRTGKNHERSFLRDQQIYPYSDFLLHDMGPGLDDDFATPHASSAEWRTAPLWGIGLMARVHPAVGFLHDGRAHTLEEAILWHGGEAAASAESFLQLSAAQKIALLEFLASL